jgi:hypothetical protein
LLTRRLSAAIQEEMQIRDRTLNSIEELDRIILGTVITQRVAFDSLQLASQSKGRGRVV